MSVSSRESPNSVPQHRDYKHAGPHRPAFTMSAEDLNSGLHECMTSMSETDLSSKYLINTHHNYVHWTDVVGWDGGGGHTSRRS